MGNCFSDNPKQQKQAQLRRPSSVYTLEKAKKKAKKHKAAFLHDDDDGKKEPRIVSCQESISTTLGKMKIRYGYISQRGYYPDGMLF